MPYIFPLPTTSYLNFPSFLSSKTHPSLPQAASNARGVLRSILKKHKRLPLQSQSSNLSTIVSALTEYIPYLLALDSALAGKPVAGEEVEVALEKEVEVEWRPALCPSIPGRDPPRVKGKGLDYEVFFVLTTLAYAYNALARSQLHALYSSTTPSTDQRANAIKTATKHLRNANSIHSYLVSRSSDCKFPPQAVDVSTSVQNALASLARAEATLLAVLVGDPYVAAVIQERNKDDKEWMIKAPDIPKVRALVFARSCLAAAEHAGRAFAMLDPRGDKSGRADDSFVKYIEDLRRTARGKACRFFGIDADLGGKTGEGIAWLRGAKKELRFAGSGKDEEKKMRGFAKLKKEWTEKREDMKVQKGGEWGADAGRFEEGRVIDMLEVKWVKMNDTVCQRSPIYVPLS
jgi:hypothetical protein